MVICVAAAGKPGDELFQNTCTGRHAVPLSSGAIRGRAAALPAGILTSSRYFLAVQKTGEIMKKRFVLILAVAWAAVMLTGCLGLLQNRVENAETGLAASLFKTYSQQTGAENGIITVSVRNLTQEPVVNENHHGGP